MPNPDPLALAALHLFVSLMEKLEEKNIFTPADANSLVKNTVENLENSGQPHAEKAAKAILMICPRFPEPN